MNDRLAPDRSPSGPEWEPGRVADCVLHPISLRQISDAPYVPELFAAELESRIVHPSYARFTAAAPTLRVRRGARVWHIPGSADDVLLHASSLMACLGDINRYLGRDRDGVDFGPPLAREAEVGLYGRYPLMWFYWARLEHVFRAYLEDDYTHVLYCDIAHCSEAMDAARICAQLKAMNAPKAAVEILRAMHRSWQDTGCPGVPLLPGFGVLLKILLKPVDDRLSENGLTYVRMQDDFRLLCRSCEEADAALKLLTAELRAIGFSINRNKTFIVSAISARKSHRWKRLGIKRTLSEGFSRPLLTTALMAPPLRPAALALLKRVYGRNRRDRW